MSEPAVASISWSLCYEYISNTIFGIDYNIHPIFQQTLHNYKRLYTPEHEHFMNTVQVKVKKDQKRQPPLPCVERILTGSSHEDVNSY
jgi:hypothetical protein